MRSHVTAFRPISEAARSWSDDNGQCILCSAVGIMVNDNDSVANNYINAEMLTEMSLSSGSCVFFSIHSFHLAERFLISQQPSTDVKN